VARRRQLFPEAEYGHYNFSVVILGAGGLGLTTAVLAKYRGADTVIVLDNNPEKVARVRSLGEGFYGVCTDWIKKSGPRLDRARLDDVHEQVRSLCRTPLMRTKGADMLLNCVSQPSAALLHHRVLSGSLEPIIVQAGGSHGPIEWDEDTNREFMTCEATIALAYRYTQADLEAAVDCISAIPHQVGHLVSSIRESSEHQFTGAQMALREAHSDGSTAGKLLVAYTNKRSHHDVVQNVTKVP
jgi:threonine dehydrogenase-like Zn-dependent dehydrogenase